MDKTEQQAVLAIALMAAFADGAKDDRERAAIKRIAEGLARDAEFDVPALYQDVLLKRRSLADTARALASPETRQLAFEMAVCVCDADDVQSEGERVFLDALRRELGLDAGVAASRENAALDKSILNYAVLNGALELLPQSLASMAIIPLQMKMVYGIGKAHGYELDRGHIRDFLGTLGVGLTSQYVEEIGRRLVGGLLKKVGGRMLGGLGRGATGAAFSFATTYALGHVAKQYYASGRTLDMEKLKAVFASLLGEAKGLQARYAGEIEQKARTIDVAQLASLVKEQPV